MRSNGAALIRVLEVDARNFLMMSRLFGRTYNLATNGHAHTAVHRHVINKIGIVLLAESKQQESKDSEWWGTAWAAAPASLQNIYLCLKSRAAVASSLCFSFLLLFFQTELTITCS